MNMMVIVTKMVDEWWRRWKGCCWPSRAGARCKVHQCNEFRLPPFITTRRCQLTTLMARMIRIILTMMKIIMMIIIKSEILIMITTILKMMVLQSHMLAWGWNIMPRKTASRWLILFSPAKDARFGRDLSHPSRRLEFVNVYQKDTPPLFQQVRAHV